MDSFNVIGIGIVIGVISCIDVAFFSGSKAVSIKNMFISFFGPLRHPPFRSLAQDQLLL